MSDVRRLVVFRFDRDPLVCRSRIKDLRAFNPGVPVHGLYGGDRPAPAVARWAVAKALGLADVYAPHHDGRWNWQHSDLALREWFFDRGHRLDFDVLHLVEWDLVLAAPLSSIYTKEASEAVRLTCLTFVDELVDRWTWLEGEQARGDWRRLREHAAQAWGPTPTQDLACLGGGPSLPRAFLEAYADVEPSELGNDELRLPLAAACLGFEIVDTGFRQRWFDSPDAHIFNVGERPIEQDVIDAELADPGGRRAFHPVRHNRRFSRRGS